MCTLRKLTDMRQNTPELSNTTEMSNARVEVEKAETLLAGHLANGSH